MERKVIGIEGVASMMKDFCDLRSELKSFDHYLEEPVDINDLSEEEFGKIQKKLINVIFYEGVHTSSFKYKEQIRAITYNQNIISDPKQMIFGHHLCWTSLD